MQEAADTATRILWALTGRQFGVCPVIARPCPGRCTNDVDFGYGPGWWPVWENGAWRNLMCACGSRCQRTGPTVIHLPGPVQSVTKVTVEGVDLAPESYTLEGDFLYRAAGQAWPQQNLRAPLGEPGTWSVEYQRGTPPPPGAGLAVGKLALEFFNACSGGRCRLPARVQQISRQGVSMQMIDPNDLFGAGLTGISEIDLWIRAHNPNRLQTAPTVR